MPLSLHIIRTNDFIRYNNKGELDLAASRTILSGLASACVKSGINDALLDVRDVHGDLQLSDLYELALAFKDMGFKKSHRLAILHRTSSGQRVKFFTMNPGERAKFFATCAADAGWNVRAFDDYEKAIEWFGVVLPIE